MAPTKPVTKPIAMLMRMLTSENIQYSLRRARPSNTAYFLRTSRYQFTECSSTVGIATAHRAVARRDAAPDGRLTNRMGNGQVIGRPVIAVSVGDCGIERRCSTATGTAPAFCAGRIPLRMDRHFLTGMAAVLALGFVYCASRQSMRGDGDGARTSASTEAAGYRGVDERR